MKGMDAVDSSMPQAANLPKVSKISGIRAIRGFWLNSVVFGDFSLRFARLLGRTARFQNFSPIKPRSPALRQAGLRKRVNCSSSQEVTAISRISG